MCQCALGDTSPYVENQLNNLKVKEKNNELKIKFIENEVIDLKLQIEQLIDTKKNEVEETIKQNGNESKTLKPNMIQKPMFKCDICDCFKREVTLKKQKNTKHGIKSNASDNVIGHGILLKGNQVIVENRQKGQNKY